MRVERSQRYPVSADELLDVLTHKEFFLARMKGREGESLHFDAYEKTASGLVIRVHREIQIQSHKVPGFAKRFIGDSVTLVSEFQWYETENKPFKGNYVFKVLGVPVEVKGQMTIDDVDAQAQQHLKVEVTSHVPFIGKKLVEMVGKRLEDGLDSDYRSTLRYIEKQQKN